MVLERRNWEKGSRKNENTLYNWYTDWYASSDATGDMINKPIFENHLYDFTQWGSSRKQILCRCSYLCLHLGDCYSERKKNTQT